jgi:histidinol dehydrogenase
MKILSLEDRKRVLELVKRSTVDFTSAAGISLGIINEVRRRGDEALAEYTKKFDEFDLNENNLKVSREEINAAVKRLDKNLMKALKHAHRNITRFHTQQLKGIKKKLEVKVEGGVNVGEKIDAIDSVGCYVPGGRASYPSTVLMTSIPAKVAGVRRIIVASPPEVSDAVLAACQICGVDEVYRIGGAQAIGALAYGTKSIKPVSKIVGPGNKYVLAAKSLVYGTVDIDMPAGPSEVLIIADQTANPDLVSADLWAQAEHDPDAQCVLITNSKKLLDEVSTQAPANSAGLLALSIGDCVDFANEYAPEHLEVLTKNARKIAGKIKNAGAIFIGPYSPVAAGDYASGGNHVLPTGGAAKFSSPLSVRDFLKTTSVQEISKDGLKKLGTTIKTLAEAEGLEKHKASTEKRT